MRLLNPVRQASVDSAHAADAAAPAARLPDRETAAHSEQHASLIGMRDGYAASWLGHYQRKRYQKPARSTNSSSAPIVYIVWQHHREQFGLAAWRALESLLFHMPHARVRLLLLCEHPCRFVDSNFVAPSTVEKYRKLGFNIETLAVDSALHSYYWHAHYGFGSLHKNTGWDLADTRHPGARWLRAHETLFSGDAHAPDLVPPVALYLAALMHIHHTGGMLFDLTWLMTDASALLAPGTGALRLRGALYAQYTDAPPPAIATSIACSYYHGRACSRDECSGRQASCGWGWKRWPARFAAQTVVASFPRANDPVLGCLLSKLDKRAADSTTDDVVQAGLPYLQSTLDECFSSLGAQNELASPGRIFDAVPLSLYASEGVPSSVAKATLEPATGAGASFGVSLAAMGALRALWQPPPLLSYASLLFELFTLQGRRWWASRPDADLLPYRPDAHADFLPRTAAELQHWRAEHEHERDGSAPERVPQLLMMPADEPLPAAPRAAHRALCHHYDAKGVEHDERLPQLRLKCALSFIIPLTMKAGTTTLQRTLSRHPQIVSLLNGHDLKELTYYNRINLRPKDYLIEALPLLEPEDGMVVGDATPTYFIRESAPKAYEDNPHARIVIVVRDPVERLMSYYRMVYPHRRHAGNPIAPLNDLVAHFFGNLSRLGLPEQPTYPLSAEHENAFAEQLFERNGIIGEWQIMFHSLYYFFVQPWVATFPREQVLFVQWPSAEQPSEQRAMLDRVAEHIGVRPLGDHWPLIDRQNPSNANLADAALSPAALSRLRQWLEPLNDNFFELIGVDFGWNEHRTAEMLQGLGGAPDSEHAQHIRRVKSALDAVKAASSAQDVVDAAGATQHPINRWRHTLPRTYAAVPGAKQQ